VNRASHCCHTSYRPCDSLGRLLALQKIVHIQTEMITPRRTLIVQDARWVSGMGWLVCHAPRTISTPKGVLRVVERRLHLRLRPSRSRLLPEDAAKARGDFEQDITRLAEPVGGRQVLDWLEGALSHALRISSRKSRSAHGRECDIGRLVSSACVLGPT
jgi:hypothetical protein